MRCLLVGGDWQRMDGNEAKSACEHLTRSFNREELLIHCLFFRTIPINEAFVNVRRRYQAVRTRHTVLYVCTGHTSNHAANAASDARLGSSPHIRTPICLPPWPHCVRGDLRRTNVPCTSLRFLITEIRLGAMWGLFEVCSRFRRV